MLVSDIPSLAHQPRNCIELCGNAGKIPVQVERPHMEGVAEVRPALALERGALRPRIEQHARDLAVKRACRMHDIREDLVHIRR